MLFRMNPVCQPVHDDEHAARGARGPRKGTTAMEYLMMLSLIVVVALTGIGYFGQMLNGSASATANAINKSTKKGP